jgi:hypothetical protein
MLDGDCGQPVGIPWFGSLVTSMGVPLSMKGVKGWLARTMGVE